MEGLDEFDGERRMDEDPVYVFSEVDWAPEKCSGSTDQTKDDTLVLNSLPKHGFLPWSTPEAKNKRYIREASMIEFVGNMHKYDSNLFGKNQQLTLN